jgi:preprotein translocase subunit SecG
MRANHSLSGIAMSLFIFLTVVQAIVAAMLVGVILMQKSEGGGLAGGGSPAGMMSARGAADFMTRLTTILAALFVGLSILLAAMAASTGAAKPIEDTLNRSAVPDQPLPQQAPAPVNPLGGGAQPAPAGGAPAPANVDPLQAPAKQ